MRDGTHHLPWKRGTGWTILMQNKFLGEGRAMRENQMKPSVPVIVNVRAA